MVQSAIKNRKGALVYRRITHRVMYFDLLVEIGNVHDVQIFQGIMIVKQLKYALGTQNQFASFILQ